MALRQYARNTKLLKPDAESYQQMKAMMLVFNFLIYFCEFLQTLKKN